MNAPLYQTVIDTILDRIASGALPPGAMLPSEMQLAKELGVAQGTARKAVMALESRGIVTRTQGRGSFVTLRTPEDALFSFFRLRRADGTLEPPQLVSETVVRRPALAHERAELHGAPEDVLDIRRIRQLGTDTRAVEHSRISAAMFPGLEARNPLPNTLYVLYQQAYSIIVLNVNDRLSAEAASTDVAQALDMPPGTPVLHIERQTYDALDRLVELRDVWCRTERHRYFAYQP